MLDALKRLVRNEPVRVAAFVASILVALAQQFNIVLDEQSLGDYIVQGLIFLGLAEAARNKVTPTH